MFLLWRLAVGITSILITLGSSTAVAQERSGVATIAPEAGGPPSYVHFSCGVACATPGRHAAEVRYDYPYGGGYVTDSDIAGHVNNRNADPAGNVRGGLMDVEFEYTRPDSGQRFRVAITLEGTGNFGPITPSWCAPQTGTAESADVTGTVTAGAVGTAVSGTGWLRTRVGPYGGACQI